MSIRVTSDTKYPSPTVPGHKKGALCAFKKNTQNFSFGTQERWWGLAELALCLAYSKLM